MEKVCWQSLLSTGWGQQLELVVKAKAATFTVQWIKGDLPRNYEQMS